MNFGRLNKRLEIVGVATSVSDGMGGKTTTRETVKTTWGSLRPFSARENLVYGLDVGSRNFECKLRWDLNYPIDQTNKIKFTDKRNNVRMFRITSVIDTDERGHEVTLIITERTD